jgi:hypothetical protein
VEESSLKNKGLVVHLLPKTVEGLSSKNKGLVLPALPKTVAEWKEMRAVIHEVSEKCNGGN